jgi:alpha-glucosidase
LLAVRPGLAYGVFFNNTWRSAFDMGASDPDSWSMESAGGELDYYLVYGPTPAEVVQGFGAILGTTPLPPRWALGYHQSRWSYTSAGQVRELAAEFRRRELPCDAIHFDIDYMDGYRDFTWHPQRFPSPAALLADLRELGIQAVMIVDPGVKIDPDYPVYQEGMELGMFIHGADGAVFHGFVWPDDAVFPDFTRPEVRRWWGEMQRQLVDVGASGIWNDMNEPTVFTLPFSQGGGTPQPIELTAVQGPAEHQTTHAEVHNVYGSGMAQASYEGLVQATAERPFVLTRSGYAGIQRWSACWMGDNTSRWEHLEMAMPQLLNMGLSGVPFVGTDIGGFFDNADGELFARWMQFGVLMPFCRGHSHTDTIPHEPWSFGPQVEAICREYLQLRYRLLPYLYTLFWESSLQGGAILRPLIYEFPDDPATCQIHDQVLLGRSLLAAPVSRPGQRHRQVYLPAGEWYDWWTEEAIVGPVHRLAAAPLERMPLYARAGAIIPSAPSQLHTGERALDLLTLDVYPGSGEFTLYEDDGISFDYAQGQFCTTTYQVRQADGALQVAGGARSGAYRPAPRQLRLRIHGVGAQASAGSAADYDPDRHILTLTREDDGAAFSLAIPGLRSAGRD